MKETCLDDGFELLDCNDMTVLVILSDVHGFITFLNLLFRRQRAIILLTHP